MKEIIKENKNLLLEFIFGTIFAETAIKIFRIKNNKFTIFEEKDNKKISNKTEKNTESCLQYLQQYHFCFIC